VRVVAAQVSGDGACSYDFVSATSSEERMFCRREQRTKTKAPAEERVDKRFTPLELKADLKMLVTL
jgi:hypothetical protein